MRLLIVAVGHRQPAWVEAGCSEYLKRMPRELLASVIPVKAERRGAKSREQLLAAEALRIRAALPAACRLIVLDERGEDLNTTQFARRLDHWMRDGRDTALLIGSADGLDNELKNSANERLRLSSLTLPHGMARLVLCEQLYRAVSLLKNHPYHRETTDKRAR